MSSSRSFIPRPGNAARPVFFVIAGFFGIMLVGYPVFMYTVGLGTGSIVWITLLIAVIAVGALWFTSYYGRSLQRDEARLDAGEVWAEWTVPEWQHRRFLEAERSSTNRMAILLALGGTALGLVLAWPAQDWLLAGIMTGSFLLAAGVTFFLGGPPRSAHGDDARHVRIGPSGVHLLGRYIPFEATMTRLRAVNISDGDPPVMTLSVHAGRRIDQIRVPIAPDRVEQAEAVAERLRREHNL